MTHENSISGTRKGFSIASAGTLFLMLMGGSAHTATDTGTMAVQLIVNESCAVGTVSNLDFGTANTPLTANIDATATIEVTCSNGTTYDIGLNAGTTAGLAPTRSPAHQAQAVLKLTPCMDG